MVKKLYSEDDEAVAVTQAILFDLAHAMGLVDAQAFAERTCYADPRRNPDLGFSDVLEKPYDVQALVSAVEAALDAAGQASPFGLR